MQRVAAIRSDLNVGSRVNLMIPQSIAKLTLLADDSPDSAMTQRPTTNLAALGNAGGC